MDCGAFSSPDRSQLDLEPSKRSMITIGEFPYKPADHEAEKASNSYVMSLVAFAVGLPFPIVNLLATFFFYVGHRKSTYFARWHCTQALYSQLVMFFVNTACFWWTMSIVFGSGEISNEYFAYLSTVILLNLIEFVTTIYAAVETRKRRHVQFIFFGPLTDLTCKP